MNFLFETVTLGKKGGSLQGAFCTLAVWKNICSAVRQQYKVDAHAHDHKCAGLIESPGQLTGLHGEGWQ